jgi:ABC-type uncharacterized transport system substrate-binding protein
VRRRAFITLLGGAAAGWPLTARAQQGERIRRIGVLTPANDQAAQARHAAFIQGLQQLGWIDGRNVHIDARWSAGNAADPRRYAAELVALAPDVILATGSAGMGPMLQATRTVPIVFAIVPDPVGSGFVKSLARPGGNATGFMMFEYNLCGKYRVPAIYAFKVFPVSGGLISYGMSLVAVYSDAASYVDRILRGEKPGDLPVQAPTKFELVINLKTAKTLGLDIPPTLLALADEVIE